MNEVSDLTVFVAVLALRLLVPLAIPRFPLPAILAALVIDGVDQTVFQTLTDLDLTSYQGYDKALDIYYLTIAYLATMRNWTNPSAFTVSRFLIYYRLVGVVLFEATEWRWLLLVFPNTFEYFFIAYELVRLRWNPVRMAHRVVIGLAAAIWIVIKLPQEWWIHVAQLDVTDQLSRHPAVVPVLVVAIVVLLGVAWWVVTRRLPPAGRRPSLDVDADPDIDRAGSRRIGFGPGLGPLPAFFDARLVEKVALVSLVSIIFSTIIPGVNASALEITILVAIVISANTTVSELLVRRGVGWETAARQFTAMAAINFGITLAIRYVLPDGEGRTHPGTTLFFLLLLTLIVTLFDRFHPIAAARFGWDGERRGGPLTPPAPLPPAAAGGRGETAGFGGAVDR